MPGKRRGGYSAGFGEFQRLARGGQRIARQRHDREMREAGERADRAERTQSGEVKARYGEDENGGHTDTYFGGVGAPDGPGHGHIRVDGEGDEQIVRESYSAGQPGARRDATLMDDRTPDRR